MQNVETIKSFHLIGFSAPESLPASLPVEADMRYYKHLISSIPPHSQSVPLILHCLLEQVN